MADTDTPPTPSGIATLAGTQPTDGFSPEDGPWRVHGVAISEDAVTVGKSETRRFWPKRTLQDAADRDLLKDRPIVKNFHELEGQAPADDVIGKITGVGYADGLGLVYEGEITDEKIAEKVDAGYLDVSPVPDIGETAFDDTQQAQRVERIDGFRDLAVVADGAVPGNAIEMGPNPAVAALSEALSQHFGADENKDTNGGDSDATTDGDDHSDDHRGSDDGPDDPEDQSTPATWRTTMSDDLTDTDRELLAAAGQLDDPTVVEAGAKKRLSDNEELLDEAETMQSPTLVEEPDYEADQEALAEFREFFKAALAEQKGVDPEMLKDDVEALTAPFRDDDDDLDFDALSQEPEAGGTSPPEGDEDVDLDALQTDITVDDRDEAVELLQNRHEQYETAGWESNAQQVAEDLEALGVEV